MKRRLLFLIVAAIPLMTVACEQPCSKLADQVCLARGGGSNECAEMKTFAEQAGLTERHYCQTALAVIKSIAK
jgi:hypothetical protein